jgi:hypothetical protein
MIRKSNVLNKPTFIKALRVVRRISKLIYYLPVDGWEGKRKVNI